MSTGDQPKPDVSVILPVFNEVTHLNEDVDRIRTSMDASPLSYELIAVDDGSTDGSTEALQALEAEGVVRLIRLPENRG